MIFINIGSSMFWNVIWFLSNELCVFYPRAMEDSFYHIFTTNIPILYTLLCGLCGVGIHNVISKKYQMSDITLKSRKICDKLEYALYNWNPQMTMKIWTSQVLLYMRKIFLKKDFSHMKTCKSAFPNCSPTLHQGFIFTNWIMHYVNKFPCKIELFYPSASINPTIFL
jgi:hypothetical protein